MNLLEKAAFEDLSCALVGGAIEKESDVILRGFTFKDGKNIHDVLELEEACLQGSMEPQGPSKESMTNDVDIWLRETLKWSSV